MVHVQHKDGDDDGERHKDHSEEEVLADQRDNEGGGRYDLRDKQEENGEGQQHRDAKGDLLATVRRQIKDQNRETRDQQTRDDEVDSVKQGEPSDDEEVGNIGVDLVATVVFLCIVRSHGIDDGPFAAFPVIVQVHCVFNSLQVYFGLVIRPGAKFHLAVLLIKWEEGDIDAAGALVDGWGDPANFPVVEQVRFGHVGDSELTVSTGTAELT